MRQESYRYFHASFIFIIQALEAIAYGLHKDEISHMFKDDWDPSSKARVSFILNEICLFAQLLFMHMEY